MKIILFDLLVRVGLSVYSSVLDTFMDLIFED